jgi:hypothetical protein
MKVGQSLPRTFHRVSLPQFGVFKACAFALLLLTTTWLHAAKISGTIKDPKGAVIAGAKVEISGGTLPQPVVLTSDGSGRFVSPDLKSGNYVLQVSREGFATRTETLELTDSLELDLTLAIPIQETKISVPGTATASANSDPVYKQLRDVGLGESYRVENLSLTWDVATFQFRSGTLTFLAPVEGQTTGAVFIGDGHFHLKPVTFIDANDVKRRTGSTEVDEDFTEIVFRFTADAKQKFLAGVGQRVDTAKEASDAFDRWKDKVRHRREIPIGFSDSVLQSESMDNVDADVLAAVYNSAHPPFFNAYIHGKKHKDIRFFLRNRVGALPQLDSSEEVALINFDPGGTKDGIWYLSHLKSEYADNTASSLQDRRLFATHRYKIETVIAKNRHLFSTATISFEPLLAGERVLKFDLLPDLRVTAVLDDQGRNLNFIQENRKADGSFYVILPSAAPLGKQSSVTVEYAGDKVIESAGPDSYFVRARTSWYPNLNGFGEHALYDLTFKVPHKYKIISIGKLEKESQDGDLTVSHWVTPIPVAVAGFNYGNYEKLDIQDHKTGFLISGYYLNDLPGYLSAYPALKTLAPRAMTEYALEQTRAQLQLCNYYFGKIDYNAISITEQPDFFFGQSWPNLVYLPISAYTDSTQRWLLFGSINNKFTGFVQEVTPHEVAHQWWGHSVGWASYHDQWLSEGFAEFSAGLFLQRVVAGDWRKDYLEFWDRLRHRVLDKNIYGVAPNDAGPLWLGLRLISPETQDAYQNLTYPKGAYVLQMLRSIMHSPDEKEFIAMMHDFVESHRDHPATTESFKAVVERHMTKGMDLQGNGKMDWFFNEWVYGTLVPKYAFDYQLASAENGKIKLTMTATQSDVNENFAMLVPVFADFGKGMVRIGQFPLFGNSTRTVSVLLPEKPKKVALNAYHDILER